MSMVPEGRRVFPDLTVKENLELGSHAVKGRAPQARPDVDWCFDTFPRLKERLKQHAGTLSGGEQQMLALGRALMGNPELLLLDEPSMGLSPLITRRSFPSSKASTPKRASRSMLVEQNAHMALDYSHRAYVLETGRVVLDRDVGGDQVQSRRRGSVPGIRRGIGPPLHLSRQMPITGYGPVFGT